MLSSTLAIFTSADLPFYPEGIELRAPHRQIGTGASGGARTDY